MATYRILAIIPTSYTPPGEASPLSIPDSERIRAVNRAAQLKADMAVYTNGMGLFDVTVKVLTDTITADQYNYRSDGVQFYIDPGDLAAFTGDLDYYDHIVVYVASNATNMSTFRGYTTLDGVGSLIGDEDRYIVPHEEGHWFTVTLEPLGYTNFPNCDPEPPMHCAPDYGMGELSPEWLHGFLSGTLSDGTGINATGWAIGTPTERGVKSVPRAARATGNNWRSGQTFVIGEG